MNTKDILQVMAVGKELMFSDEFCFPMKKTTFWETGLEEATLSATFTVPLFLFKTKKTRIENFYEEWIGKYENYDFFTHFRMSKETFSKFLDEIQIEIRAKCGSRMSEYNNVPVEKGVLLTLWWLAKGETLSSCADRFNVGISTAHGITTKNLVLLVEMRKKFIKWPNYQEAKLISQKFFNISGYPRVIGAIDGTHFECVVPREQHDSYVNRKLQHTIIMQGICDSNKILRDIFVGFPGSCNDGRVLRESPFYLQVCENPNLYFFKKYHLLGDKAYTCLEWLITPYKDTGRLSKLQKKHNYYLSKARVLIENVFGLLKGRWRIVQFINVYSIEKVVNIVVACVVLHNICLMNNDFFETDINSIEDNITDISEDKDKRGIHKRNSICETSVNL